MNTKQLAIGNRQYSLTELILPVTAFSIPFLIQGPQWLVGTFVNCILFYFAVKSYQKLLWAVVVLPSLGALTHGVIFGKFTPLLLYFLPFIWIGNYVLVKTFLSLRPSDPPAAKVIIASLLKTTVLYLSASFYFHFHLIPRLFLTSMGTVQLITALTGGILALFIVKYSSNE